MNDFITNVSILFFHRSANYNNKTGECDLTDMDRITLAGGELFEQYEGKKHFSFVSKIDGECCNVTMWI